MRRVGVAALLGLLALVLGAGPARAHAGDDRGPSNHRIALRERAPVAGADVRLVQAETAVELRWSGDGELLVLGYDDEPYLRFDDDGVAVNTRSPATYLNASYDGEPVPPTADRDAAPVWEPVADAPVHRWHDHRFHPPTSPPPDDSTRQVVAEWAIPLVADGDEAALVGVIEWVPPAPAWPWWLAAAVIAAVAALATVGLGVPALLLALVVAAAADVLRVVGILVEVGGGWSAVVEVAAVSAVGWGLAVATVVVGIRRPADALAAGALAGAIIGVAGGVLELGDLTTSQLTSTLPVVLARGVVVTALGAGLGAAAGGALSLLRPATR
jgi:hypothetical protein